MASKYCYLPADYIFTGDFKIIAFVIITETVYEKNSKTLFLSIKNSGGTLNKL